MPVIITFTNTNNVHRVSWRCMLHQYERMSLETSLIIRTVSKSWNIKPAHTIYIWFYSPFDALSCWINWISFMVWKTFRPFSLFHLHCVPFFSLFQSNFLRCFSCCSRILSLLSPCSSCIGDQSSRNCQCFVSFSLTSYICEYYLKINLCIHFKLNTLLFVSIFNSPPIISSSYEI